MPKVNLWLPSIKNQEQKQKHKNYATKLQKIVTTRSK